ncbi:MAG TPA: hypothetical protein VNK91_08860 [Burkholderiaceae bacterium]|nr:hypothetical protein [Burkholderiaceae bacterium]
MSSRLHRENLVGAMVSGYKPVAAPATEGTRWAIALLLLLAVGLFWSGRIPAPGLPAGTPLSLSSVKTPAPDRAERRRRDDDD